MEGPCKPWQLHVLYVCMNYIAVSTLWTLTPPENWDQTLWYVQVGATADERKEAASYAINGIHGSALGTMQLLAAACADGSVRLLTLTGGVDKQAHNAHTGAAICVRWNHSGTAFASGGEDGAVKIWSATGLIRATIAQNRHPVHALAWSPDSGMVSMHVLPLLVYCPKGRASALTESAVRCAQAW
jgi:WD40 repeat protein